MLKTTATALLVLGAAVSCTEDPLSTEPLCSQPAPLLGVFDSQAPGYIVRFVDTTNAETETARLAQLYHFTPKYVYQFAFPGFAAPLSSEILAAVRCERSVSRVWHDAVAGPLD